MAAAGAGATAAAEGAHHGGTGASGHRPLPEDGPEAAEARKTDVSSSNKFMSCFFSNFHLFFFPFVCFKP
jgi:hypothetical protein